MHYWLMKSEPEAFSIEDLRKQKVAGWDGVRNYQARNYLRYMRKGDLALFYHSSAKPSAIAGVAEIVREAYPDPTQFDPKSVHYDPASTPGSARWDQVDVRFVKAFARPLSLEAIRGIPVLRDMVLLKRGRLSVQPVTPFEWRVLEKVLR
jgi:predicted RNA-binding protein with PUA-like domain